MITGIHAIVYTKHSEEVYVFLRDVLGLDYVDAGNGRLFFAAPPTELAVHERESEGDAEHELWLMCDDVGATVRALEDKGVTTTPVADHGWGLVTQVQLAGGDVIGLYEPKHPSPNATSR